MVVVSIAVSNAVKISTPTDILSLIIFQYMVSNSGLKGHPRELC